jgi:hypothetical protein
MPSGVSSKVRSQIRGLKNSKSSNDKSAKKVNKTANKFAKGGRVTRTKTNEYGVNYPSSSAGKYETADKSYTQTADYRKAIKRDEFIRDSTHADNASYKRVMNGGKPFGNNLMKNGNSAGTYAGVKAGEARALRNKSANKKAKGGKLSKKC